MAKIKIKAGAKAVDQAQKSAEFEEAPVGLYIAEVKEAEAGYAKNDDKTEDKNRPYLKVTYTLLGVGRDGDDFPEGKRYWPVRDYVSFGENSEWKVAQFGLAMGLPIKNGVIDGEIEIEPKKRGTIVGTKVLLSIKADTDQQGEYRAKVRNVNPLTEGEGGSGSGDSGLFDDDEDGEPSGDLDDTFGEDEGTTDGEEYLTLEELLDTDGEYPDLKSLGELAKEFDLTPQDYIVKGTRGANKGKTDPVKTRAALAEAIIEAQGADGDEEGEGAPDEDDPF